MKRVLITDDCHPILKESLAQMGFVCDDRPDITPAQTLDVIGAYSGLIINSKITVDKAFLDAAVKLEFIGRLGSGMEIVDQVYAGEKGVAVCSSPEGNCNAVAEQALGMLLALANNLVRADAEVRKDVWRREANRGFELMGRSIGIIGFGHTGSQFARKLSGMGMRVMAHDKYKTGFAAEMPWVEEVALAEIQAEADIVSLHLPLRPDTLHYFDQAFIQKCKPGFLLINTSRGKCVKTVDLVEGLELGSIGGACLDVFENEKPGTYTAEEKVLYGRLHGLEQVVFSPHVAGWTHESKQRLAEILIEKIKKAMRK